MTATPVATHQPLAGWDDLVPKYQRLAPGEDPREPNGHPSGG